MHDVISVMVDKEIGIGCFTETWFSSLSNSTTAIIKDAGFDIVHCYREKRGGGPVCPDGGLLILSFFRCKKKLNLYIISSLSAAKIMPKIVFFNLIQISILMCL